MKNKTETSQGMDKSLNNPEPHKEPELADEPIYYNRTLSQKIPWMIDLDGHNYRVSHTLLPISNERFFAFQDAFEAAASKLASATAATTAIYNPKYQLWRDIVEDYEGWERTDNWKDQMLEEDCLAAINALTHVYFVDETSDGDKSKLLSFDKPTTLTFQTLQSGALLTLSLSFRRPTQQEKNEALSIQANEPPALASAQRISLNERLYNLGKKMLVGSTGYEVGTEPPPWHVARAIESFFEQQAMRMTKFLRR